jgi:hypothetical protein
MGDTKPEMIDAANQVIVLAFDLADSEVTRLPNQIVKALESPLVQDSIKKTLMDFAKSRAKPGSTVISDDEARKLFGALGTGVKDAASQELLNQIKKTPEFKKLEASLEGFKQAAASTSLGVWVDKNKNILYVVGAALVVGTVGVLYVTKTGGAMVDLAVDPLKGKKFEVLQIGRLKIAASVWDFKPDARLLGARVFGTLEWEKVKVDLKLGVLAEGAKIKEAEGEAVVKSGSFSVAVTGKTKPQVQEVNLALKFSYDGVIGNGKFNLGLGAIYNVHPQKSGGPEYGGMITLTIPFD